MGFQEPVERYFNTVTIQLCTSLECGGLAPLWRGSAAIGNKATPGRRTPKRCVEFIMLCSLHKQDY